MNKTQDLQCIRETLVDRIAQNILNRREQAEQPRSAASKELKDLERAVAYWREQVNKATTNEARDYALERIHKLARFIDARPSDNRL